VALLSFGSPSRADEGIGAAVGLTPAATGTQAGRISIGSQVFRDETVQTGPSGVLELQFVDKTRLALGASSAVTLDRFVYSGNKSDSIVLGLSKGAFRFATGVASKKSYQIQTPLASIGVRGTRFTARVTNGVMRVTLEEGGLDVCAKAGSCASLNKRNETVDVYRDGTIKRVKTAFIPALYCSQGAGSLCVSYGSNKVGPIDPATGNAPDAAPANAAPTRASSPPSAPDPGPGPGPDPGDGCDHGGGHHGNHDGNRHGGRRS